MNPFKNNVNIRNQEIMMIKKKKIKMRIQIAIEMRKMYDEKQIYFRTYHFCAVFANESIRTVTNVVWFQCTRFQTCATV